MKPTNRGVAQAIVDPPDRLSLPPHRLPAEQLFGGPRPASWRRGTDPAFLLLEREVVGQLHAAAAALSVCREALVARIARDHLDEY